MAEAFPRGNCLTATKIDNNKSPPKNPCKKIHILILVLIPVVSEFEDALPLAVFCTVNPGKK